MSWTSMTPNKIIQDAKDIDFWLCEEQKLCDGQCHIVFAHPESFISSKYGRDLLLSKKYTENVVAIVVDVVVIVY